MCINKHYVAGDTVIEHVDGLLMLMSAMKKDYRFEETINEVKGKENLTMCEVLDRVEARGREEGIKEGIKEGTVNILISLVNDGILSIADAAKRADMSEESFRRYLEQC